jgi:hypothetical protein
VLKEAAKIPKHELSDGTFDKWLQKATFWSQVNAYPSKTLNFLFLKRLQTDIQYFIVGGGGAETIFYNCH